MLIGVLFDNFTEYITISFELGRTYPVDLHHVLLILREVVRHLHEGGIREYSVGRNSFLVGKFFAFFTKLFEELLVIFVFDIRAGSFHSLAVDGSRGPVKGPEYIFMS